MRGHVGLNENSAFFGVYAAGKVQRGKLQGVVPERRGRLLHRYGVHIDNAEYAVVLILQLHPIRQRSEIISDSNLTAWLYSAEYDLFCVLLAHLHRPLPTRYSCFFFSLNNITNNDF